MKIALDWIADYLDQPLQAEAARDALINAGLPIESIEEIHGTSVLDVEVTSNRSDCLSHVGLARELSALLGRVFRYPTAAVRDNGAAVETMTAVRVEDAVGCPYYAARVIEGVKVGPSPECLRRRLESIGLRSINNVVDVTNFILMELGQPLHAFDLDTLAEQRVVVRRAREKETLVAINGQTYTLDPSMLVIADAEKPAAIAGVMGGKTTEVGEKTTRILLESARFDQMTIRSTARALSLMSDSSYRFERGIDPLAADAASRRAAQMIAEIAGGTVARGAVGVGEVRKEGPQITLRPWQIKRILGIEIPVNTVLEILQRLGFSPRLEGGLVEAQAPTFRLDVEREIDLIEEVARVHGYEKMPVKAEVTHKVTPRPAEERAAATARGALLAAGFSETITVTFVDEAEAVTFLPAQETSAIRVSDAVRKASNVLRPSLLPSLLAVRRTNQNAGTLDARLFEVAQTFYQAGAATTSTPSERTVLSAIGNSVAELRGLLQLVVAKLSASAVVDVVPASIAYFMPGAAGDVRLNGKVIGRVGLFSSEIQKKYDLREAVAGMELDWAELLSAYVPVRRAKPLPKFQGATRDLSLVLSEATRYAEVESVIWSAKPAQLEKINFVGTFRGKQVEAGKKSLTLSLEFRDPAATLRSEQVDEQMKAVIGALGEKLNAVLRA